MPITSIYLLFIVADALKGVIHMEYVPVKVLFTSAFMKSVFLLTVEAVTEPSNGRHHWCPMDPIGDRLILSWCLTGKNSASCCTIQSNVTESAMGVRTNLSMQV